MNNLAPWVLLLSYPKTSQICCLGYEDAHLHFFHSSKPTELWPQPLKKGSLDKEEGGGIYVLWTHFSSFYLCFFSDVVMTSHNGDETKTIGYMSKFLKCAPEKAGGGGRKENWICC